MTNYDLYKELKVLKKYLIDSGEPELATELDDAVSGGSTGTEIFMHVKHILVKFNNKAKIENQIIADKIDEILDYLENTLN